MNWIPVSERLPERMETVLVRGGIAFLRDDTWYSITALEWPGRPIQWQVTHWMPFPEFPE